MHKCKWNKNNIYIYIYTHRFSNGIFEIFTFEIFTFEITNNLKNDIKYCRNVSKNHFIIHILKTLRMSRVYFGDSVVSCLFFLSERSKMRITPSRSERRYCVYVRVYLCKMNGSVSTYLLKEISKCISSKSFPALKGNVCAKTKGTL